MSPMRLLVPRAALWSALVGPPERASRLLPALVGRSVASYNGPRDSVPPPVRSGSDCGVLPRAALCSVVVDTPCGLPVHPRPSVSVVGTVRSPSGPDRARALLLARVLSQGANSDRLPPTQPHRVHQVRRSIRPAATGTQGVVHHVVSTAGRDVATTKKCHRQVAGTLRLSRSSRSTHCVGAKHPGASSSL